MTDTLIIVHASELLTLKGPRRARQKTEMSELGAIPDGALAVSEGVIIDVGRTESILRGPCGDRGGADRRDRARSSCRGSSTGTPTWSIAGSREFELELKTKGKSYMQIMQEGGGIYRTVRDTRAAPWRGPLPSIREAPRVHDRARLDDRRGEIWIRPGQDRRDPHARDHKEVGARTTRGRSCPTYMGAHAVAPEYEGKARTSTSIS